MPSVSWTETVRDWQPIIASCIAIAAAAIAWSNTTRTLRSNARSETKRRQQKHAALRATLPLSLSEITSYCSLTVRELQALWGECVEGSLPKDLPFKPAFPELPNETVKAFADFIEFSDNLDTSLFRRMLARLQVSRARTRDLESAILRADQETVILENTIEEYILDAATIHAAAAAAFDYGREKLDAFSKTVTWDQVRGALRNMRIWDHDIEELYETINRREAEGIAP